MAARKKASGSQAAGDGEGHLIGMLVERFDSKLDALAEGMVAMEERLGRRFDDAIAELRDRIRALEEAVRQNSADIKQNTADIRQNSEDIRNMRDELRRLRHDFDSREELARIASLEARVTKLEHELKVG